MSNKSLEEALDEVVNEIKSMSREELNAKLNESSQSEFAKSVDQFFLDEDIFDTIENLQKEIEDRANFITAALLEVVNNYPNINLIDDIYSFSNLKCTIRKWTETTYPPNPDFVDSKTSLSWITVETDYIDIHIERTTDIWDNCDERAVWSYNKIPYMLGIKGSKEELMEFFEQLFKEKIDNEERRNNETKYSPIFNMDYDVVRKILEYPQPNSYNEFNAILNNIGLKVFKR